MKHKENKNFRVLDIYYMKQRTTKKMTFYLKYATVNIKREDFVL